MSTENIETPVEPITEDLDAFSAELFGQSKADPEPASSEATETDEDVTDATETEDTQTDETDTLDTEDDTSEETPEEDAKPKKNRFQERIDGFTRTIKEAERREQAMAKRIEELESNLKQPENKQTETATEVTGPAPNDTNEDGTEKYPLGEFDPHYIRDLTKFTLQQESAAQKVREQAEDQKKQYDAERKALTESWQEKLVPAQERYPDFQDKGEQLFDTFSGIDQNYGEYLTATIMSMDHGPDVLYYLANNIDEANKIVAGGPTKATIALGRLEAKFVTEEAEKTLARPKVSKAPPPPTTLKGAHAVQEVPDDTDDLDAFSKKFFKK